MVSLSWQEQLSGCLRYQPALPVYGVLEMYLYLVAWILSDRYSGSLIEMSIVLGYMVGSLH